MTSHRLQLRPNIDDAYNAITPQNVKRALLGRFQDMNCPNPLECLSIINDYVADCFLPNNPYGRRYALMEILIEIIIGQLGFYRNAMDICHPPLDSTRKQAFTAIEQDARTGNSFLIGWSWLYYGYVRVDLQITQQLYGQYSLFDKRTIRRYQEAAFSEAAVTLIHKESVARQFRCLASEAKLRGDGPDYEITITELLQVDKPKPRASA